MTWYEKTVDLIIKGVRWEVTIAALAASGALLFFPQRLKGDAWATQYCGIALGEHDHDDRSPDRWGLAEMDGSPSQQETPASTEPRREEKL